MAPNMFVRAFAAWLFLQAIGSSALVVQRSANQTTPAQPISLRDIASVVAGSNFFRRVAPAVPVNFFLRRSPQKTTVQDAALLSPGETLGSILIWAVLTSIIAYFFHKNRVTPEVEQELDCDEERDKLKTWKVGVFSCANDPKVNAVSFFCPSIRWAHSMSMVNILGFWSAFAIFYTLAVFNAATAGLFCWIALAFICTYYRQALRTKFGMEQNGWVTLAEDCICYAFCTCCTVAQEAIQIDAAARCNHQAVVRESKEKKEEASA